MHPYRKTSNNRIRAINASEKTKEKPALCCCPPVKHTQLSCILLGGNMLSNSLPTTQEKEGQAEIVPVIVVVKCPCCKKVISKETIFMSSNDNEVYYHSFVEGNVPGIVKFEPCAKCWKNKLVLVQ